MLKTEFWRERAASLPQHVRERHLQEFEGAERFEAVLDLLIRAPERLGIAFAAFAFRTNGKVKTP